MLKVTDLNYSIGERKLLNGISITVFSEKKAVIGENGSGKTTLFEIIAGNLKSDSGVVEIKGTFAYIPQEVKALSKTGIEEIEEAFSEIKKIEVKLLELERKGDYSNYYYELLEKYNELGGYKVKALIAEKLDEIAISDEIVNKPFYEMSGGERTKCLIVKAILMQPDLLLIDEPTNHLDIETIEYLEKYLISFKGGVLLVTHDKTLINNVADTIINLENGHVKEYPGNYDQFIEIRKSEDERLKKERDRLIAYIEKNRAFIEKFRYGTRSTQAKSREKMINKIEVPEVNNERKIEFSIESKRRGGEKVVEIIDLKKSFGNNIVLKGVNLTIFRGERIAILGRNGCGKSTLLKIIAGEIKDYDGVLRTFESIDIAYFPQDAFILDEDSTVIDEFLKEGLLVGEARSFLGNFNFEGEDVFKKINELSGGEKRRLLVAKLSLIKGNFLCLDEPTNHLDIPSKEAVVDALKKFEGTILIVTHDREILKGLVNKIYYLEDGTIKEKESKREKIKMENSISKEKNKIKARIEYLEKLLEIYPNEKKERELRILKKKLKNM